MIDIDIIISEEITDSTSVDIDRLKQFALVVCRETNMVDSEINIIFIGDRKMAELNETYKKRTGSTDVLSFNLSDDSSGTVEGEIYISADKAIEQSADYDVSFEEETVRLVTHGLLHLAGRVHNTEKEYDILSEETERLSQYY
ncbi:rRNA maturation RNase YbeY [Candidatus Latescibacterota bacterium]